MSKPQTLPEVTITINETSKYHLSTSTSIDKTIAFENMTGRVISVINRDGTVDIVEPSLGINRHGVFKIHYTYIKAAGSQVYITDEDILSEHEVNQIWLTDKNKRSTIVATYVIPSECICQPNGHYLERFDILLSTHTGDAVPLHPNRRNDNALTPVSSTVGVTAYYVNHTNEQDLYAIINNTVIKIPRQDGISQGVYFVTVDDLGTAKDVRRIPAAEIVDTENNVFLTRQSAEKFLQQASHLVEVYAAKNQELTKEVNILRGKLSDLIDKQEYNTMLERESKALDEFAKNAYMQKLKYDHDVVSRKLTALVNELSDVTAETQHEVRRMHEAKKTAATLITDIAKIKM